MSLSKRVSTTPYCPCTFSPQRCWEGGGGNRKTEGETQRYTRGGTHKECERSRERVITRQRKQVIEAYIQRQQKSRGLTPPRPCSLWSVLVRCWPVVNPVNHQALPSITSLPFLLLIYFSIDRCLSVARVTFAHWYWHDVEKRIERKERQVKGRGGWDDLMAAFLQVNNQRLKLKQGVFLYQHKKALQEKHKLSSFFFFSECKLSH